MRQIQLSNISDLSIGDRVISALYLGTSGGEPIEGWAGIVTDIFTESGDVIVEIDTYDGEIDEFALDPFFVLNVADD